MNPTRNYHSSPQPRYVQLLGVEPSDCAPRDAYRNPGLGHSHLSGSWWKAGWTTGGFPVADETAKVELSVTTSPISDPGTEIAIQEIR